MGGRSDENGQKGNMQDSGELKKRQTENKSTKSFFEAIYEAC